MNTRIPAIALALAFAPPVLAQPPQTLQDEYAVYDLLLPDSASFRTIYEVAVTTPGATVFLDRIGSGLTAVTGSDDAVVDLMTGAPLKYNVTTAISSHALQPSVAGRRVGQVGQVGQVE